MKTEEDMYVYICTSQLRVLCKLVDVLKFNRLIKLKKILFLIHVEQLSTTALANLKLALHRIYADYVKF